MQCIIYFLFALVMGALLHGIYGKYKELKRIGKLIGDDKK